MVVLLDTTTISSCSSRPRYRRSRLILEPAAGMLEIQDSPSGYDACNTTCHLLDRILYSGMPIRRQ
jgi:hypothetical protein